MGSIYSTAYLMGGLGNQMFQIAHAVSQGLKHNIKSVFLPHAFTPSPQSKQTNNYINNIFRNITFVNEISDKKKLSEHHFNDPKINVTFDKTIEFNGYYQSSKNFFGFDNFIKDMFSPSDEFTEKIYKKYPQLKNKITTSIHIRRGDYLSIKNVLPVIDITYINYCINHLNETEVFFIFSDDKEWVRNNIKNDKVIIVDDMKDYEDMWMISLCKNNIMSKSSFSWWGSFLNKNINKRVLTPSIWFGPNGLHPHFNIYESEWEKINVKYVDGFLKI